MNKSFGCFVVLIGIVYAAISSSDLDDWNNFKSKYSKVYQNATEENRRMAIFLEHKHQIAEHNQQYENGLVSYKMGLNKYSDLSSDEFRSRMNTYRASEILESTKGSSNGTTKVEVAKEPLDAKLPKSIDWRDAGAVSPVRDQEFCGSCWAFSAVGAVEGQQYLKSREPIVPLSVQNLVDCVKTNAGCLGGAVDEAYQWIMDNQGIAFDKSYPYTSVDGMCKFNGTTKANITIRGFKDIPIGNEHKLQEALATVGPIAVAIHASHDSFRHYKSGIYHESKCEANKVDHGVLAVGYGVEKDGREFYIVKNSWGPKWGEKGFFRILRNSNNHCGLASQANWPVL